MTWTLLPWGNLKRKTESLLITAQNNAVRTNYIKAAIDNRREKTSIGSIGRERERERDGERKRERESDGGGG